MMFLNILNHILLVTTVFLNTINTGRDWGVVRTISSNKSFWLLKVRS
jgi:hypothetical protein